MNFFKILTIKGKKHCFVDFLRILFFGLTTRPSLACLQEHRGSRVVFRRIKSQNFEMFLKQKLKKFSVYCRIFVALKQN